MLIGICGGSCSGKTTICKKLMEILGEKAEIISFDDYYEGPTHLVDKKIIDWEDLQLYRFDKFAEALKKLKAGKEIEVNGKSRESFMAGIKSRKVKPAEYIFVEGFLIFHTPELRELFDRKIYIELPDEEIVKRRLARPEINGSDNDLEYLNTYLLPAHHKNTVPQKEFADIVLDGTKPVGELVEEILELIRTETN